MDPSDQNSRHPQEPQAPASDPAREERRRQRQQAREQKKAAEGGPVPALLRRIARIPQRAAQIRAERRQRHFPESERPLVQFVLLLQGLGPMLFSQARERWESRRLKRVRRAPRWVLRIHPLAYLLTGAAIVGIVFLLVTYTRGVTVRWNGELFARVSSQRVADAAIEELKAAGVQALGADYEPDTSPLTYESSFMRRGQLMASDDYSALLFARMSEVVQGYSLYVGDERIGSTPYSGALDELLVQLKRAATDDETVSCDFAEEVSVREEYIARDSIMNLGKLAELLYSTKEQEITYTVRAGDTWSEIAERSGLTSKELLELNPGYNINLVNIGDELTLKSAVPYLTMTVVEREHYVTDIPYEINYTETSELYKGDYKVVSPGQIGKADNVATVTYVNGEEVDRSVISTVVLRSPVEEERLQGTAERPSWLPTGSFRWPCSGPVTSYFGGRRSPGGIGSTNHKGIDIANSYGTPICAADGGTVSYAGWMSGYGYIVIIDHGDGVETRYGHNSSLLVSVGDHVYKGQQIARMGSTGNSTGNHCHFEIRIDGTAQNPLNYLP